MSPKLREQEREAGECWPCSARADYPLWPDSSLTWIRLTAQLTQLSDDSRVETRVSLKEILCLPLLPHPSVLS